MLQREKWIQGKCHCSNLITLSHSCIDRERKWKRECPSFWGCATILATYKCEWKAGLHVFQCHCCEGLMTVQGLSRPSQRHTGTNKLYSWWWSPSRLLHKNQSQVGAAQQNHQHLSKYAETILGLLLLLGTGYKRIDLLLVFFFSVSVWFTINQKKKHSTLFLSYIA